MELSVIVCTYNREDIIRDCLDALVNQDVEDGLFEVLVIDNNSSDRTQQVVTKYTRLHPNFHLFFEGSQGLSYARNLGLKESKADYVAYIDDDAIFISLLINLSCSSYIER